MRIVVLIFLLLLSLSSSAQLYYQAGLNASGMHNKGPIETQGVYLGYQHGIGLETRIVQTSDFSLGGALLYNLQGYRQQKAGETYAIRMHYLQLPLYGSYPVGKIMRAEGGAYIAGLLRAKFVDKEQKYAVAENYRTTDYGLLAGLHVFPKNTFSVYIRYQHSIRPQLHYPNFDSSGQQVGMYRLLQPYIFTVGVRLNFLQHE